MWLEASCTYTAIGKGRLAAATTALPESAVAGLEAEFAAPPINPPAQARLRDKHAS